MRPQVRALHRPFDELRLHHELEHKPDLLLLTNFDYTLLGSGIVTALKVALAMKAQAQKVQRASQRRTSHMLNEKMLMQQATLAGRATFHGDFGGTAQSPEHRENKTFHV